MTDYAEIVFAKHPSLTERADMVANAFNHSAANAAGYMTFKQAQDDRASAAMTEAFSITQSGVSLGLLEITDVLDHNRSGLAPEKLAEEEKKFAEMKTAHHAEKPRIQQLKPELDELSQLFRLLAAAEAKMTGFDAETLRHTGDAKDNLIQLKQQLATDDQSSGRDANKIATIERRLHVHALNNNIAAEKAAFSAYLNARPAVPAPMQAPAIARFRKKDGVTP